MEGPKQVIAVRSDLDMSVGKTAAQVAHASLSAYKRCLEEKPNWAKRWLAEGQMKIVCQVDGEEEIQKLEDQARERGIPSSIVEDRGLTEVPPGTVTCIGLGPAPYSVIDPLTRSLRLLK